MKFPTITMDFQVIAGHRLPASKGLCKFVHGHSYIFRLTLARRWSGSTADGCLNADGMVADFDEVKELLAPLLRVMDHCFFVQESDPLYTERTLGNSLSPTVFKFYRMPGGCAPTAENLAVEFFERASTLIGGELEIIKVTCVEAPGCEATYSSL